MGDSFLPLSPSSLDPHRYDLHYLCGNGPAVIPSVASKTATTVTVEEKEEEKTRSIGGGGEKKEAVRIENTFR